MEETWINAILSDFYDNFFKETILNVYQEKIKSADGSKPF